MDVGAPGHASCWPERCRSSGVERECLTVPANAATGWPRLLQGTRRSRIHGGKSTMTPFRSRRKRWPPCPPASRRRFLCRSNHGRLSGELATTSFHADLCPLYGALSRCDARVRRFVALTVLPSLAVVIDRRRTSDQSARRRTASTISITRTRPGCRCTTSGPIAHIPSATVTWNGPSLPLSARRTMAWQGAPAPLSRGSSMRKTRCVMSASFLTATRATRWCFATVATFVSTSYATGSSLSRRETVSADSPMLA